MAQDTTHWITKNPAYNVWKKMRDRCNNPRSDNYKWYGAKGVRVCKRWDDFATFLADMGPRPSTDHTIDRIDPNKGYNPLNCRWATRLEQQRSKRHHWKVEVDGIEMLAVDYAKMVGIDRSYIYRKLALFPPPGVKLIAAGLRHQSMDFTAMRASLLKSKGGRVPGSARAPGTTF